MLKKSLLLMLLMTLLVPWTVAQQTITVYDQGGTTSNSYVPMYGGYFDDNTKSEFVIPAAKLTDMDGDTIMAMKFHIQNVATYGNGWASNQTVFLKEVESTQLSAYSGIDGATVVYTGQFTVPASTDTEFEITFTTPYAYNGGNLLVGIYNEAGGSGNYRTVNWKGETVSGASGAGSSSSSLAAVGFTQRNFIPQTTFTYVTTDPWISLSPSSTTVFTGFTQNLTASYGNVSGTPTITYSSSNNKIASVSGSGTSATVTGESVGTATITATMTYNATEYTAICDVTVEDPSYCTPSFSNTNTNYGLYIKTFSTTNGETNISNTTSLTAGGYADYFDTNSASVEAGKSIDFTVTPGSTNNGMMFAMWIDWNKDFDFNDDGENVAIQSSRIYTDWTGTITIPAATPVGDYRLRIVGMYSGSLEPCTSGTYGEGEDYKLTVLPVATCIKPTGLTVDNGIATWDEGSASLWNLHYKKVSASSWTTVEGLTDATYIFPSNLETPARYEVQVQADCGGGDLSYWTNSETFDVCATITSFPWSDNFAEITPVTDGSVNNLPACWSYINTCTNSSYLGYPVIYANSGNNYLVLRSYYNSDPQDQYAILPEMDNVSGLKITFNSRIWNSSSSSTFTVGVMEDPSDATTFEPIKNITPSSVTPEESIVSLNSYTGSGNYIAFKMTAAYDETGHYQHAAMIKDITVEELPKCPEPTDFTVSSITSYTATLTWIKGSLDQSAWQVYYSTDMTDPDDDINTSLVTPSLSQTLTLSDLTAGTEYYAWVRGDCSSSSSGYSTWVGPIFFYTPVSCTAPTAPTVTEIAAKTATFSWTGDAGNYDVKYSQYPTNTEQELTYSVTQASNYGYNSATTQTWGVKYPASQITGNVLTKVGLHYNPSYNSSTTITIKVYSGGNLAPGTLLYTEVATPNASTGLQTITLSNPVNISSEKNLWITITEYGTFVKASGACTDDNNNWLLDGDKWLHFSVANLGWIINGYMETWNFEAASWTTASCTENTCALTGLTPETDHVALVRSNCGSTDGTSLWAMTKFTTGIACPAPTGLAASEVTNHTAKLSWTGTSESYVLAVGTYDYTATPTTGTILEEGFESWAANTIPTGWTHLGEGSISVQSPSSAHIHGGSKAFRFSGTTSDNIAVLPNYGVETNQLTIDFWMKAEGTSSGTFEYGYVTDASNATTFTKLGEYSASTSTSYQHVENLSMASAPNGARIAFKHKSGSSSWYWFIDDLTITGPTYPIAYTEYNTSDMYKTVEGLLAETPYFAKVKGNCGSEGYSQETAVISFTTDIACPAPTSLTPSNPTSVSFDLSWNNGGASDWIVAYKKTTETDFTEISLNISDVTEEAGVISYTLGGLDDDTEYTVKVRDNCEASVPGDGVSAWTAEVTYSTIPACSALNPVVSNITHHNATVNWEGESGDGYTVKYRTSALVSSESPVFYEAFNNNSSTPPTGWTRYTGLVDGVLNGTVTLSTTSYGWYTNNTYALGAYNAQLNIYGTGVKTWLVTPEVTLTEGLALSFDLALTDYNSGDAIEYPTQQPDDRFVVLVFADDAWHILREWNNSGSSYVYNTIATTGENVVLDLAAYAGKTIKVAFYGESTVAGAPSGADDNDLHIDNVLIGTTIPAGDWQTQAAATTTANLSGLTAGTKYDVKIVPNCDPTLESDIVNFTTLSSDTKYFVTEGEWETAANWMDGEIPTSTDDAIIRANVTITNYAEAKNVTLEGTPEILIADGAEFVHNNAVNATYQKSVYGYGNPSNPGGWNFIASPVNSFSISPSNNMPAGPYDLYMYNEPNGYWYSNTGSHPFSTFTRGIGYLYANQQDVTWNFTGSMIGTNTEVTKTLSFAYSHITDPDGVKGFNLMGNPYTRNLEYGDVTIGDEAMTAFLRLDNGDDYEPCNMYDGDEILPGQGFFYQVDAAGKSMKFKKATAKDANEISLISIVAGNDSKVDKAFVQIGAGNTLRKIAFSNSKSSVYVINDGDDYAAATIYELAGTMPVHFKAVAEGEYDITVNTKNIEASTLILFDDFIGEQIDLLETPSYSFKSSADDPENRFKLIFDFNNNNNYNGVEDNFTSEIFVYQSGDELIVNGEGELQIFDVLGRLVTSKNISGVERIGKPEQTGVYIFRLNEHTQKLIIK